MVLIWWPLGSRVRVFGLVNLFLRRRIDYRGSTRWRSSGFSTAFTDHTLRHERRGR